MSPVERALRELRVALGDRLPPATTEARLREAGGHLQMATVELGEKEAVRRFGPPRLVANEMVRVHRGYPTTSASRLAFAAGAVLCLAIFLPPAYMQMTLGQPQEFEKAVFLYRLPPLGLLAFLGRIVQTRRWLVLPGAFWATVACAATLAFCAGFNPTIGERDLPVVRENVRREIAMWTERTENVAAWRRGGFPLHAPHLGRIEGTAHYSLASYMTSGEYLTERVAKNREAAKADWQTNGAAWAKEVSERLENSRGNLAALPHMFPRVPIPWGRLAGTLARGAGWSVVFMVFANAVTLGACALLDRRRMRRT